MQPQLQGVERQYVAERDDQLAVEQEAPLLRPAKHLDDLGKIARERFPRLGRERDLIPVAARKAAEAIPLGLILPAFALRQLGREQCLHRCRDGLRHSQSIARWSQSFPLRALQQLLRSRTDREEAMKLNPQVEAATARYVDSLGPAALQKAHVYTVGKEWMLLWSLIVAALVTWLIVKSGMLDKLDARLKRPNVKALAIGFVYFIVSTILTLPWTLYAAYFREKAYGRTSQPIGDFLGQLALSTV